MMVAECLPARMASSDSRRQRDGATTRCPRRPLRHEEDYLRTGMARIDEDGLSITGRIKEMLIIGGENVFPRGSRRYCAASFRFRSGRHRVTDPSRGEVPLAFIETVEGADFDPGALRSWCRESLAGYGSPRDSSSEALPRNPTGKVLRRR